MIRQSFFTSIIAMALFTVLFGALYPALVTAAAHILFPARAEGSLIVKNGAVLGSASIGQNFSAPKYFWGRLSATTPAATNAANSSGSNMSPANPALLDAAKARLDDLRKADPGNTKPVPVDLVTASASGLDPHISPAAAVYQAGRVARERNRPVGEILMLIKKHTEGRQFGIFGEDRVNVLILNLDLDNKL
jgi:potassium-transporting ATPase KdpC subunit